MTELAGELSRRATPDYVRGRARERTDDMKLRAKVRAQERTAQVKDKVMENPWTLGLVGGAVGAIAGKLIGDRAKERYEDREYGPRVGYDVERSRGRRTYGYGEELPYSPEVATGGVIITEDTMYGLESAPDVRERTYYESAEGEEGRRSFERSGFEGAGFEGRSEEESRSGMAEKKEQLKERAAGLKENLSHRTAGLKENLSHRTHDVRERVSHSAHGGRERMSGMAGNLKHRAAELREHAPSGGELRHRVSTSAEEHAPLWGLGAMAAGILFGLMMPITNKERRVLGPAKSKGIDQARRFEHEAVERARGLEHAVRDTVKSQMGLGGASKGEESRGSEQAGFTEERGTYTASEEGSQFTPTGEPDITRH